MAGFTDSSLRAICMGFGADACTSEMISAKALRLGDRRSSALMYFTPAERPFGIQLFGADPDDIAFAAKYTEDHFSPDFIDINMGCPAPKITGSGAGSKLMTDPALAAEIASAAVSAVSVPVTCKIRAGYHEVNADTVSVLLERSGVSAITVHGRTRDRMYTPPVDLSIIKRVKESVSIPVIGNGDIQSADDAVKMMQETGCDAVMIGRGALGYPFIFREVSAALSGDHVPPPPSFEEKISVLRKQAESSAAEKGEYTAMREMRKQAVWYFKGISGAASIRSECVRLETIADLDRLCDRALGSVTL